MSADLVLPLAADLLLKSSVVLGLTWVALKTWRQSSASQRACVWCVAFALVALLPLTRLVAPHWVFTFAKAKTPVESSAMVVATGADVLPVGEVIGVPPAPGWDMPDGVTLGVAAWLAGIVALAGYRVTGALLLDRCRRASLPLEDEVIVKLTEAIREEFGIARRIELRVSRDCRVPVTWGTWRPVVLLPAEAMEWPREWLESALRHELAHVRNCDHLKRLGAFLISAVYWPNPLGWMAAKQLQLAQEEACDNLVLRGDASPQDYAAQLVALIRLGAGRRVLSLSGVAMARPSTLEGRLAALLDESRNRGSADGRLLWAGTGLALLVGLAFGAVQLRAQEPLPPDSSLAAKPGIPLLQQKLKSIVFDKVNFDKTDIADVIQFLQRRSKELDPGHQGVGFVLRVSPGMSAPNIHREVTLALENVPLGDVLDAITRQTNLQYVVEDYAIYFRPAVDDAAAMSVRTYLVPEGLRGALVPAAGQPAPEAGMVDVKAQLSGLGFRFPVGATATYLAGKGKMVVRDTPEQLDKIAALIEQMSPPGAAAPPASPSAAPDNSSNKMLGRIFYLSDKAAQALQIAPGTQGDVSPILEKRGIDFQPGTEAVLQPGHQLEVKNAYPEMKKIEALLMAVAPQDWHSPAGPESGGSGNEATPPLSGAGAEVNPAQAKLEQKLASIHVSVDFNATTIDEAVSFLTSESKRLDLDHQGVSFILNSDGAKAAKPITLTLANVTLGEALRNIGKVADVKFSAHDYAIVILPATAPELLSSGPPSSDVGLAAPPNNEAGQAILRKIKSIVIDKVNFNQLDVARVLQFLAAKTRELDPDKKGINFVLGNIGAQDHVHREVSVTLDNVPMEDVLGYITTQTNLQWSIKDGAVFFAPANPAKPAASGGAGSPQLDPKQGGVGLAADASMQGGVPKPSDGVIWFTADGNNTYVGDVATADDNAVCHFQGCTLAADHLTYNRTTKTLTGMRHAKLVDAKGNTVLGYQIIVPDCDKPLGRYYVSTAPRT